MRSAFLQAQCTDVHRTSSQIEQAAAWRAAAADRRQADAAAEAVRQRAEAAAEANRL